MPWATLALINPEKDSGRAAQALADPRRHWETIVASDAGLIATRAHAPVCQEGGCMFGSWPMIRPERNPRQVFDYHCCQTVPFQTTGIRRAKPDPDGFHRADRKAIRPKPTDQLDAVPLYRGYLPA